MLASLTVHYCTQLPGGGFLFIIGFLFTNSNFKQKNESGVRIRDQETKNRELMQLLEQTQHEMVARKKDANCQNCETTISLKNAVEVSACVGMGSEGACVVSNLFFP